MAEASGLLAFLLSVEALLVEKVRVVDVAIAKAKSCIATGNSPRATPCLGAVEIRLDRGFQRDGLKFEQWSSQDELAISASTSATKASAEAAIRRESGS